MGKRERHFQKISELKEKYEHLSTDAIRYRLNVFGTTLVKEAAIALRRLLEEREQQEAKFASSGVSFADLLPRIAALRLGSTNLARARALALVG